MNTASRAAWLALALSTWPQVSAAQPALSVDAAGCLAETQWPQLQHALSVELADYSSETPPGSQSWRLRILRCSLQEGLLEVAWQAPNGTVYPSRAIDLRDVPAAARARVAAITLAELVRTWTAEALAQDAAVPGSLPGAAAHNQPLAVPAAPSQPQHAAPSEPRLARDGRQASPETAGAAPIAQRSLASLTLLLLSSRALTDLFPGAAFNFALATQPWLRPQLGVSYFQGENKAAIGVSTLHGFEATAAALFALPNSREIQIGPRLSVALLRAHGRSVLGLAESADSAWIGTASVYAQHLTELTSDWALVTGFAFGHTWRGAHFDAGAERAFSLSGTLLEVRLGLAFGL